MFSSQVSYHFESNHMIKLLLNLTDWVLITVVTLRLGCWQQNMTIDCCVCFERYQSTGDRSPLLLPCTHTVCLACVTRLVEGVLLQCPECQKNHPVPRKGARGFPINRYILENIKLAERNAALEGRGLTGKISEAINEVVVDYIQPSAPPMELTTIQENIKLYNQNAALEGRGGTGDLQPSAPPVEETDTCLNHVRTPRVGRDQEASSPSSSCNQICRNCCGACATLCCYCTISCAILFLGGVLFYLFIMVGKDLWQWAFRLK